MAAYVEQVIQGAPRGGLEHARTNKVHLLVPTVTDEVGSPINKSSVALIKLHYQKIQCD